MSPGPSLSSCSCRAVTTGAGGAGLAGLAGPTGPCGGPGGAGRCCSWCLNKSTYGAGVGEFTRFSGRFLVDFWWIYWCAWRFPLCMGFTRKWAGNSTHSWRKSLNKQNDEPNEHEVRIWDYIICSRATFLTLVVLLAQIYWHAYCSLDGISDHIHHHTVVNLAPWLMDVKNMYVLVCVYIYITQIYISYMVVDQNSFIPGRPFFANKNSTFAKLSQTPCLSFAGPMLANNTSYEDSFTTCQITPENHGSLLGSLLNMQLASRNPFSGQLFFAKFTGPPPSTCTLKNIN